MIGLLLALYPASWRRRYGDEFRAVLESRPLGPFDVADVLLGALDARARLVRHAGSPERHGGPFTMLRIGGVGAVAGGTLWVVGFVAGSVLGAETPFWGLMLLAGTACILLALVGLSAFQARNDARLAWAAVLIPGLGAAASMVGTVGMLTMADTDAPMLAGLSSWSVWALGTLATLVGCVLFGLSTYRAGVLSRPGAIGLVVSPAVILLMGLGLGGNGAPTGVAAWAFVASLMVFAGSWVLLGVSALRRGPIRAIATA